MIVTRSKSAKSNADNKPKSSKHCNDTSLPHYDLTEDSHVKCNICHKVFMITANCKMHERTHYSKDHTEYTKRQKAINDEERNEMQNQTIDIQEQAHSNKAKGRNSNPELEAMMLYDENCGMQQEQCNPNTKVDDVMLKQPPKTRSRKITTDKKSLKSVVADVEKAKQSKRYSKGGCGKNPMTDKKVQKKTHNGTTDIPEKMTDTGNAHNQDANEKNRHEFDTIGISDKEYERPIQQDHSNLKTKRDVATTKQQPKSWSQKVNRDQKSLKSNRAKVGEDEQSKKETKAGHWGKYPIPHKEIQRKIQTCTAGISEQMIETCLQEPKANNSNEFETIVVSDAHYGTEQRQCTPRTQVDNGIMVEQSSPKTRRQKINRKRNSEGANIEQSKKQTKPRQGRMLQREGFNTQNQRSDVRPVKSTLNTSTADLAKSGHDKTVCRYCQLKLSSVSNCLRHERHHTGTYGSEPCAKQKHKEVEYVQNRGGGLVERMDGSIDRSVARNTIQELNDVWKKQLKVCQFCKKECQTSESCQKHEELHKLKPYGCKLCTVAFANINYLEQHVKRMHPDVIPQDPTLEPYQELTEELDSDSPSQTNKKSYEFMQDTQFLAEPIQELIEELDQDSPLSTNRYSFEKEQNIESAKEPDQGLLTEQDLELFAEPTQQLTELDYSSSSLSNRNYFVNEQDSEFSEDPDQRLMEQQILTGVGISSICSKESLQETQSANKCKPQVDNLFQRKTEEHKLWIKSDLKFECFKCKSTLTSQKLLNSHEKDVHKRDLCVCQYCKKRFSNIPCRVRHERLHTNSKPYKCKTCMKGFPNPTYLVRHAKREHLRKEDNQCGKRRNNMDCVSLQTDPADIRDNCDGTDGGVQTFEQSDAITKANNRSVLRRNNRGDSIQSDQVDEGGNSAGNYGRLQTFEQSDAITKTVNQSIPRRNNNRGRSIQSDQADVIDNGVWNHGGNNRGDSIQSDHAETRGECVGNNGGMQTFEQSDTLTKTVNQSVSRRNSRDDSIRQSDQADGGGNCAGNNKGLQTFVQVDGITKTVNQSVPRRNSRDDSIRQSDQADGGGNCAGNNKGLQTFVQVDGITKTVNQSVPRRNNRDDSIQSDQTDSGDKCMGNDRGLQTSEQSDAITKTVNQSVLRRNNRGDSIQSDQADMGDCVGNYEWLQTFEQSDTMSKTISQSVPILKIFDCVSKSQHAEKSNQARVQQQSPIKQRRSKRTLPNRQKCPTTVQEVLDGSRGKNNSSSPLTFDRDNLPTDTLEIIAGGNGKRNSTGKFLSFEVDNLPKDTVEIIDVGEEKPSSTLPFDTFEENELDDMGLAMEVEDMEIRHKRNTQQTAGVSKPDLKQCSLCGKHFSTKYSCSKHEESMHLGIKACKCPICGMACNNPNELKIHRAEHLEVTVDDLEDMGLAMEPQETEPKRENNDNACFFQPECQKSHQEDKKITKVKKTTPKIQKQGSKKRNVVYTDDSRTKKKMTKSVKTICRIERNTNEIEQKSNRRSKLQSEGIVKQQLNSSSVSSVIKSPQSQKHTPGECFFCGKYFTRKYNCTKHERSVHVGIKANSPRKLKSPRKHLKGIAKQNKGSSDFKKIKNQNVGKLLIKKDKSSKIEKRQTDTTYKNQNIGKDSTKKDKPSKMGKEQTVKEAKLHDRKVSSGQARSRRPGTCTYCGKLFTRGSTARVHEQMVHLKLKLFKCDQCGASFKLPDSLNKHKKRMHQNGDGSMNRMSENTGNRLDTKAKNIVLSNQPTVLLSREDQMFSSYDQDKGNLKAGMERSSRIDQENMNESMEFDPPLSKEDQIFSCYDNDIGEAGVERSGINQENMNDSPDLPLTMDKSVNKCLDKDDAQDTDNNQSDIEDTQMKPLTIQMIDTLCDNYEINSPLNMEQSDLHNKKSQPCLVNDNSDIINTQSGLNKRTTPSFSESDNFFNNTSDPSTSLIDPYTHIQTFEQSLPSPHKDESKSNHLETTSQLSNSNKKQSEKKSGSGMDQRKVLAWVCDQCDMEFVGKKHLVYHQRTDHGGDLGIQGLGRSIPTRNLYFEALCTPDGFFKCGMCPAAFTQERQLRSHEFVHSRNKEQSLGCPQCGTEYKRRKDWVTHMNCHNRVPVYACMYCEKNFRVIKNWWRHEKCHEDTVAIRMNEPI